MAGEMRGALAEAIAKVAIEIAISKQHVGEKVFWEEAPQESIVWPDLTIGPDKDHPTNLILINASDTVRISDMTYLASSGSYK
jgi:hypothetical protein